jgi:tetratricopeptide (TPR) repeat protein
LDYEILLDFLSGWPDVPHSFETILAIGDRHPDDPLVQYLVGFQRANHGQWEEAIEALSRVGEPELWPDILIREAAFRAGRLSAYLDRFDGADDHLERALRFEPLVGHRVPIQRWRRYVDYYRSRDTIPE